MSRKEKLTDPWKAHTTGMKARQRGWTECPYDDLAGTFYWRQGYDGISMHTIAMMQYSLQGLTHTDPVFVLNRPVLVTQRFTGGWNETGQAFIR